jgi:hypothetical protein
MSSYYDYAVALQRSYAERSRFFTTSVPPPNAPAPSASSAGWHTPHTVADEWLGRGNPAVAGLFRYAGTTYGYGR